MAHIIIINKVLIKVTLNKVIAGALTCTVVLASLCHALRTWWYNGLSYLMPSCEVVRVGLLLYIAECLGWSKYFVFFSVSGAHVVVLLCFLIAWPLK